jgi:hypothetical protein
MSKRKYKVAKYRDGGRVLGNDIESLTADASIERDAEVQQPPAMEPTAEKSAVATRTGSSEDDNVMQKVLQAAQRAEQLQRQAAEPRSEIDRQIDAWPISDQKKSFLRAHPNLLHPAIAPSMKRHYEAALAAGYSDDTPAVEKYILDNVAREIEHRQQLVNAKPAERETVIEPDSPPAPAAPQPEPAAPAARRSVQMSAPVSRSIPSTASGLQNSTAWNTLSAEERQIAHHSFTAPDMSNAQKELLYLRQRQKLQKMKADGSYSEQR